MLAVAFLNTTRKWIVFCSVLIAPLLFASDKVDFSIVDRIQFAVPGDWKVIASKSSSTQTTFAFQIPNPADEGTPDSTNLALLAYNLNDASAKTSYLRTKSERGPGARDATLVDGWNCSTFSAAQGTTTYLIWDCDRKIGKTGVFVRAAWPHLSKNSPDYDRSMETALANVLKSVVPYSIPAHGDRNRRNSP